MSNTFREKFNSMSPDQKVVYLSVLQIYLVSTSREPVRLLEIHIYIGVRIYCSKLKMFQISLKKYLHGICSTLHVHGLW